MVGEIQLSKAWNDSEQDLPWMSSRMAAEENDVTAGKQSLKWLPNDQ